MKFHQVIAIACCFSAALCAADSGLAKRNRQADTRWATFENPTASKGEGGRENKGAKGHPADNVQPGETKTLLDVKGSGEIRRIWITIQERDPQMLRSLRFEIYWDGAATPAVTVPMGDFFGAILGRPVAFENELFADPEGRSFICYIPMPYRTAARVTLTNDSARPVKFLFYDVDFLRTAVPDPEALYFHAIWHRERPTTLGRDFEILPKVHGEGRFLGVHAGIIVNPENTGWWGEGEVKMYLDGDTAFPTIVGTGTEDYIGTGWGQGIFHARYQGSLIGDEKTGQYAFYRYHIPDPVYFHRDIRVTIQQMGGDTREHIEQLISKGVPVRPVTTEINGRTVNLLDADTSVPLSAQPGSKDAWTNIYRRDDWSAVALFYLDSPENGLPRLAPLADRTAGMPAAASAAK